MISLQISILGTFEARFSSGEVVSLPTRKLETLLTYLALAQESHHSRDRLANLLWSDRSEEQARNSLRQSLSALKKALDNIEPPPIQVERTDVRVAKGSIGVDAVDMECLMDLERGSVSSGDPYGVAGYS